MGLRTLDFDHVCGFKKAHDTGANERAQWVQVAKPEDLN